MYSKILICCLIIYYAVPATAMTDAQRAMVREHFEELGKECITDNPVPEADLVNIKMRKMPDGDGAGCFLACVFRKIGVMDDDGTLHHDKALDKAKAVFDDAEELKNIESYLNSCKGVNSEPVTDGAKGCQRSMIALKCMIENASQFALDF